MYERDEMIYSGIARLELELLVRDFFAALSNGKPAELLPFLHNNVELIWCGRPTAAGPRRVLNLWQHLVERMATPTLEPITVAVTDQTVLVEHNIRVHRTSDRSTLLPAFASIVIQDFQVICWRELCG